ncbi:uncharacterized protein LOC108216294 [Daucus carota subsp. sativus]|nr:PREDICTED: uncharacterized protein LOC108216294 [Daucus carota subsp. sativus]
MMSSPVLSTPFPLHKLPASRHHSLRQQTCSYYHLPISRSSITRPFKNGYLSISVVTPANEGAIPVMNFEDLLEKDWSFLDTDHTRAAEVDKKIERIMSAGEIGQSSMVLVSIGSEQFVDKLVESSPCQQLLIVHDSLLTLACIKEKYDKVSCWQGELIHLPEKWASFDVVFLYFLPSLTFLLDQVLQSLASRCLPGARLVISHPGGREELERQRQQYPDVIVSNLPDEMSLENAAASSAFEVIEFVDEPDFYLAVLKIKAKC